MSRRGASPRTPGANPGTPARPARSGATPSSPASRTTSTRADISGAQARSAAR